ncbi:alcohol dehydrogenase catalytic domain-containing protein [Rhodococcus sp. NPDC057529]|uniref:alcohol dehydrogenase catalytic domain-containing protein n=1 Tax=Rhodococcus sp. NPDC057529 TaxID=3346158 RepID=UPI00366F3358
MSNSPPGLMKAWRLTEPGGTLQLCEIARPRAHDDWAVVNVRAAGLCHTDVGLLSGELTGLIRQWPITLGHEISGVLTEVVDPACPIPVGTSVGIAGLSGNTPGVHFDGGYAEQILIPWRNLVPVPAGIPASVAAVATDAGATAYNAVHVSARIQPGDRVGVVGLGGLGMLAARIAVVAGAEVYGVDVETSTFVRARNIGVTECFETIAPLATLNLDCILDFAGFGTTTAESIE